MRQLCEPPFLQVFRIVFSLFFFSGKCDLAKERLRLILSTLFSVFFFFFLSHTHIETLSPLLPLFLDEIGVPFFFCTFLLSSSQCQFYFLLFTFFCCIFSPFIIRPCRFCQSRMSLSPTPLGQHFNKILLLPPWQPFLLLSWIFFPLFSFCFLLIVERIYKKKGSSIFFV